jgi:tryptophanyl-tRNA synthetase
MSLKDGLKKMSKSELSDLSRINLTDKKDQIVNKIKKAKTDALPIPSSIEELKERPEAKNLLSIFSSISDITLEKSIQEFSGKTFSHFKESLTQILVEKITPISNEIEKLLNEKDYLNEILSEGCKIANKTASKKIEKLHNIIGF